MHLLNNRVIAVGLGAVVLVAGADLTAYATTGHSILGHGHGAAGASAKPAHKPGAHVYEYVVPKHTPVPFEFRAKGLPKGHYTVDLSISTEVDTSGSSIEAPFCGVSTKASPFAVFSFGVLDVQGTTTSSTETAINTASGLVNVASDGGAFFSCTDALHTHNNTHSQNMVVFTPVAKVTRGKLGRVPEARNLKIVHTFR